MMMQPTETNASIIIQQLNAFLPELLIPSIGTELCRKNVKKVRNET